MYTDWQSLVSILYGAVKCSSYSCMYHVLFAIDHTAAATTTTTPTTTMTCCTTTKTVQIHVKKDPNKIVCARIFATREKSMKGREKKNIWNIYSQIVAHNYLHCIHIQFMILFLSQKYYSISMSAWFTPVHVVIVAHFANKSWMCSHICYYRW